MASLMEGEWDWQNPQGQDVVTGTRNKRRIIDALRRQAVQPQGQMVGQIYVPPSITQYLASGLNQFNASQLENKTNQEEQAAIQQRQQQMQAASQRLAEALRPKQAQTGVQQLPFEPSQMDRFGSPQQGQQQPTQPVMGQQQPSIQDMLNAQLQYAQDLGDPRMLQGALSGQMNYQIADQQRQDDRAFRSQEAEANRQARMQELAIKIEEGRATRQEQMEFRRDMQREQIQARRDMNAQNIQARRDMAGIAAALKTPTGEDKIPWKYDAGSDEFVAPPTPEFPMGRRSGNVSKQNAGQSMDYIINQFKGGDGKQGVLDKTMQGGALGISGQIGKVVDYQDQKRFNNLKEQMSTELRTLFRIPGEGALSDREQAQYGIQLPDVSYDKATNEAILEDVRNRIKLRTQTPNPLKPTTNQIIPQGQAGGTVNGGWSVKRK